MNNPVNSEAATGQTAAVEQLLRLYRGTFDVDARDIAALRGDGSERMIFRLHGASGTVVGIWGGYVPENRAFVGFSRSFAAAGLPVPAVYAVAEDERAYLEEDLGDTLLYDWQRARREGVELNEEAFDMYARVVRDLVRFQVDAAESIDYGLCYQWPDFGVDALRFDMRYFREQFLDRVFPKYDAGVYENETQRLVEYLLGADRRYFLYRDFQSRNVMILRGEPRYIDYQSGRRGALHYDIASMLFDAKAALQPRAREMLLEIYLRELALRIPVDEEVFRPMYEAYSVARVLQALGAFGKLGLHYRKPGFRSSIPPALANLEYLSRHAQIFDSLGALRDLMLRLVEAMSRRDFSEVDQPCH